MGKFGLQLAPKDEVCTCHGIATLWEPRQYLAHKYCQETGRSLTTHHSNVLEGDYCTKLEYVEATEKEKKNN